ncbi:MAG TPA: hypothetical protein VF913_12440 [Xanthobacteraceae bacterium]
MSYFLKSEGFLTEDEEAAELRKSKRTLGLWRQLRKGPAWTTDAGGTVYYKREWNLEFLMGRKQRAVREPTRKSA